MKTTKVNTVGGRESDDTKYDLWEMKTEREENGGEQSMQGTIQRVLQNKRVNKAKSKHAQKQTTITSQNDIWRDHDCHKNMHISMFDMIYSNTYSCFVQGEKKSSRQKQNPKQNTAIIFFV